MGMQPVQQASDLGGTFGGVASEWKPGADELVA